MEYLFLEKKLENLWYSRLSFEIQDYPTRFQIFPLYSRIFPRFNILPQLLFFVKNWKKSWSTIRDFPISPQKTSIIKVILTFFDIFQKKQFYIENIKNVDFWRFFEKNQLFFKKMWLSSAILKNLKNWKKWGDDPLPLSCYLVLFDDPPYNMKHETLSKVVPLDQNSQKSKV